MSGDVIERCQELSESGDKTKEMEFEVILLCKN